MIAALLLILLAKVVVASQEGEDFGTDLIFMYRMAIFIEIFLLIVLPVGVYIGVAKLARSRKKGLVVSVVVATVATSIFFVFS
ncbi:hypothetical protein [Variovorax paradoxus]|uniref:hypothetical protein n=1 Tax=Variovorax paradoxus TaxID=34073 RepID=UPI003D656180